MEEGSEEEAGVGGAVRRWLNNMMEAFFIEVDKVKFYLPDELLYKINNPDAEFIIQISVAVGVVVMIAIAWKMVPPSGPRLVPQID